jgi:transposase
MLTTEQRTELETRERSRRGRADAVRRARVILLLAAGETYTSITAKTGCSSRTIALWKGRFEADGTAGLAARRRGSKPTVLTPTLQARILAWTRRRPPHGATHWSTRSLGRQLGVHTPSSPKRGAPLACNLIASSATCARPIPSSRRRRRTSLASIWIRRNTPWLCVDEKTAIQALDRIDPLLPLSPGRAERHGFEYYRHGTLSWYAALNTRSGEVLGSAVPRHTSDEFVAFLASVVDTQPRGRAIHVIVDNLSAHKTQKVRTFLATHPTVRLHYTPTYSSWLNQVELWFSKIERDVIARGIFTSVTDLRRKLMRYIKKYNKTAKPFRWSYSDPTRRIA